MRDLYYDGGLCKFRNMHTLHKGDKFGEVALKDTKNK